MAPDPKRHESDDQEVARDLQLDGLGHERGEQIQPARKRLGRMLRARKGVNTPHGEDYGILPALRVRPQGLSLQFVVENGDALLMENFEFPLALDRLSPNDRFEAHL